MEKLSACGLFDCEFCEFRTKGLCPGCQQGNALLDAWGRPPCSIYACVQERGIENCKACTNTVCSLLGVVEGVCPLRAGVESKSHWLWRISQYLRSRSGPCEAHAAIPVRTVMRLRWYMTALEAQSQKGCEIVSSRDLAKMVGIGSAMVRKDFSHFGVLGTPGVGYNVSALLERFRGLLDQHACQVVWIGAAWLSSAYPTFVQSLDLNFRIVAAFDTRPEWIGKTVAQWEIRPLSDLPTLVAAVDVDGAVLALLEDPKGVADAIVKAGIHGILNLTPTALALSPDINVRQVDLVGEMMALAETMAPVR